MIRMAWMSLVLLLTANVVRGETIRLDGLVLDLPSVPGLCPVDRDHPSGRKFYEQQERAQSGRNLVLSLAIDCRDVEAFRQGGPWRRWASWTIAAPNGKPARIPEDFPRTKVFLALGQSEPALDKSKIDLLVREASQREGAERNVRLFGIIDRDRYALYKGDVTDRVRQGRQTRMVGVIATAPIRKSIVTLSLFRVDQESFRFDELLAEAKLVMKAAYEWNGEGMFR